MIESAVIPPRKDNKPGEPLPEGKKEVAIIPPQPEPTNKPYDEQRNGSDPSRRV